MHSIALRATKKEMSDKVYSKIKGDTSWIDLR